MFSVAWSFVFRAVSPIFLVLKSLEITYCERKCQMLAQLKVREEKARFLIQAFKYAKNQATDILSSNPVQSYIQHFCSGES